MQTMRIIFFMFCYLAEMTSTVLADEKLPVLKVGSETYSNVAITTVSATDIYFNYDKGMANVKLKNLDPVLQKHFHYNAEQAASIEQKQAANQASSILSIGSKEVQLLSTNDTPEIAAAKKQINDAVFRVQAIVNQPVTRLARTPDMNVKVYAPGWFHADAQRPNFNSVDVRVTQQASYDGDGYVTSDLNPGLVFVGRELEFNSMTKYFYTDRTVPKRKLTGPEMLEINRLYRIIGQGEEQLSQLQNPKGALAWLGAGWTKYSYVIVACIILLALVLFQVRKKQSSG